MPTFRRKKIDVFLRIIKERKNKQKVNFTIPNFRENELLDSSLLIKKASRKKIKGVFHSAPRNRLVGKTSLMETPVHSFYGNLIKDTYTLKSQPDRNFGRDTNIYFYDDSTAFFEWKFDGIKDDLFKRDHELNSYLEIYLQRAYHKPTTGYVYLPQDKWQENTLTQNNKPSKKKYIEFDIPSNYVGKIQIGLKDLISSYDKREGFNQDIAIKIPSSSYSFTYSREGNIELSAKLYYNYYAIPPNMRRLYLPGELTIKKEDQDLLPVSFSIDSDYYRNKLQGKIKVPKLENKEKIKSNINILEEAYNNLSSHITIPVFRKEKNIKSFMKIIGITANKIAGTMAIPTFQKSKDLKNSIVVKRDNKKKFGCNLYVPIKKDKELLCNKLTVKKHKQALWSGQIKVPKFKEGKKTKGILKVPDYKKRNNLSSRLILKRKAKKRIKSSFCVNKEKYNKIFANIKIKKFVAKSKLKLRANVLKARGELLKNNLKIPTFYKQKKLSGNTNIVSQKEKKLNNFITIPTLEQVKQLKGDSFVISEGVKKIKCNFFIPSKQKEKPYVFIT